jgi:hypothetical protein
MPDRSRERPSVALFLVCRQTGSYANRDGASRFETSRLRGNAEGLESGRSSPMQFSPRADTGISVETQRELEKLQLGCFYLSSKIDGYISPINAGYSCPWDRCAQ